MIRRVFRSSCLALLLAGALQVWAGVEQGLAAIRANDFSTAIAVFRPLAVDGNPDAQFQLGMMYQRGQGVQADLAEAMRLFHLAAAQNQVDSLVILGLRYITGRDVQANIAKGIEYLERASRRGSTRAMWVLGSVYMGNLGLSKNMAVATYWFQKAAELGDVWSQQELSRWYLDGENGDADIVMGNAWLGILAKGQRDPFDVQPIVVMPGGWIIRPTAAEKAEIARLITNWRVGQRLVREVAKAPTSGSLRQRQLAKNSTGTAFFVNPAGVAVTNHHVVDGCTEVRVEGSSEAVRVIAAEARSDLALLQIHGAPTTAATIGAEPSRARQGDELVVFGFPLSAVLSSGGNVTQGVVSALSGMSNNRNQMQFTAPIQPGSSGSPVLNRQGVVIGVVAAKLSDQQMARATGQVAQNVNFAVGGQTLRTFLDAHGIAYRSEARNSGAKSVADVADEARRWTMAIECWQ